MRPTQTQPSASHAPADRDLALDARELSLFTYAESASEAWAAITGWYTERGRSIFDEPGDALEGNGACG